MTIFLWKRQLITDSQSIKSGLRSSCGDSHKFKGVSFGFVCFVVFYIREKATGKLFTLVGKSGASNNCLTDVMCIHEVLSVITRMFIHYYSSLFKQWHQASLCKMTSPGDLYYRNESVCLLFSAPRHSFSCPVSVKYLAQIPAKPKAETELSGWA